MIGDLVPGGLEVFRGLDKKQQDQLRIRAIDKIRQEASSSGKTAILAGHFMFWREGEENGVCVCTQNDLDTYTHILYLDVPAELIAERRKNDHQRNRPAVSIEHLRMWQNSERDMLRMKCYSNGILFLPISPSQGLLDKVSMQIRIFREHTEATNKHRAIRQLDDLILEGGKLLKVMLVLDGDKTLSAKDTGELFWKFRSVDQDPHSSTTGKSPLKALFGSPLGYSYNAFLQASLLYEETLVQEGFETYCTRTASAAKMYPQMVDFIQNASKQVHVGVMVLTCGLQSIWEKIIHAEGLSDQVKVFGSGRMENGLIISPDLKSSMISRLQNGHRLNVYAFGDSPVDLPMLKAANHAVVVVGDENTRSKSMESALSDAIRIDGLQARQILIDTTTPRLNTTKVPIIQFENLDFINTASQECGRLKLQTANTLTARLLMTPTRDARIVGPFLQEAHKEIGWYLAVHFLATIFGVEHVPIPHVQGHETDGYRLRCEKQTLIIALMRGGEPMASGVLKALPLAQFLHASDVKDIKDHLITRNRQVLLVDSVINSGRTVVEFVRHIRKIDEDIPIVIIAGVVQSGVVSESEYAQELGGFQNLSLVALRSSDHKYVGRGGTDTGNRLFNTTNLP